MEYRPFGQTGIQISAIGIGCWEIGGGYGSIEETDFIKAVNRALDLGINSFDTAEAYGFGASERSLAKALGGRRKEAVITTKFGVGYPNTPNYRDASRKRMMASYRQEPGPPQHRPCRRLHGALARREHAVRRDDAGARRGGEAGKARAVAISNFTVCLRSKKRRSTRRIDVVQYCWNMFDRRMQKEIFPLLPQERNRRDGLRLTGVRDAERHFQRGDEFRFRKDWRSKRGRLGGINLFQHLFGPEQFVRNIHAVEELKAVAKRYGKSLPQLALRWTTSAIR